MRLCVSLNNMDIFIFKLVVNFNLLILWKKVKIEEEKNLIIFYYQMINII